ncbi:MAG: type 4a pilus biogenesis protein PilO [Candidatus Zixiibacteriota bacterium]
MDLKDPKTQRLLLGGLVIFLVVYFWYARIYSKNATRIEQKQAQYENLMTGLKNVEMKTRNFGSLKEEYHKLLARYRKMEPLLPEERQIPLFLMEMHSAAQVNQTGILQIIPRDPVPTGFYNTNSYDVELSSAYDDFGNFLSNVANFPFLANVSGVTITAIPQEGQTPEQMGKTISASLKLTTYYIKEGERLKEVEF